MADFAIFKDTFEAFCRMTGRELTIDENHCSLVVDGNVVVNLELLEESETVVAWAAVGTLPDDGLTCERASRLLAMNEPNGGARGFTLAMDGRNRMLVAHDRRAENLFASADVLAGWIDDLVSLVNRIRSEFARDYPFFVEDPVGDREETTDVSANGKEAF